MSIPFLSFLAIFRVHLINTSCLAKIKKTAFCRQRTVDNILFLLHKLNLIVLRNLGAEYHELLQHLDGFLARLGKKLISNDLL